MPNTPGQYLNQEIEVGTNIYRWNGSTWEHYGYVFGSKPKSKSNVLWWAGSMIVLLIIAYFLFFRKKK